jgi:hypothetical protein
MASFPGKEPVHFNAWRFLNSHRHPSRPIVSLTHCPIGCSMGVLVPCQVDGSLCSCRHKHHSEVNDTMRHLTMIGVLTMVCAMAASAGNICPGGNSTNFVTLSPSISGSTGHDPDPANTGCNTLITINSNLTVTVTIPDGIPYDGVEDNLVGVLNNSSILIGSLLLSGTDIFGLDGDGICRYTWAAANGVSSSSYCSSLAGATAGTDPQDYFGPTVSQYQITNVNSGAVFFSPVIAPGGRTFFSLEEPPNASLQVTPTPGVPEPGPMTLVFAGAGSLWIARRRFAR